MSESDVGRAWSWVVLVGLLGCGQDVASADSSIVTARPPAVTHSVALGDLSELSPSVRRAFEAHPEDFSVLPEPGADDWRTWNTESPQSVGNYWVSGPNRPGHEGRDTLYILPLGPVPDTSALETFARDFFATPVVVLEAADLSGVELTRRTHGSREQVLAGDLQTYLKSRLPEDAYAMLGLTSEDIYPSDDYNYVFGLASTTDRTGVFSLARYDPRFYEPSADPNPVLQRERAFKILAHEAGHMFGIGHCLHFACVMNGANHSEELDRAPLALCPVCLRKLHLLVGFDPKARYDALERRYAESELTSAAAFARTRADRIAGE
ncbi:MAG: archaemetzincin [Nannocystales bacterium]